MCVTCRFVLPLAPQCCGLYEQLICSPHSSFSTALLPEHIYQSFIFFPLSFLCLSPAWCLENFSYQIKCCALFSSNQKSLLRFHVIRSRINDLNLVQLYQTGILKRKLTTQNNFSKFLIYTHVKNDEWNLKKYIFFLFLVIIMVNILRVYFI